MARLLLVRHGQAAAGWGGDVDPGLSPLGEAQAVAVVESLAGREAPMEVLTSPLLRARETAQPLAARWGSTVRIDPAFGEIPSPSSDLAERAAWLPGALAGSWDELGPEVERWRARLVEAATSCTHDTVAFTHFVAINALVTWAEQRAAVTAFLPANASVTVLEVGPGRIEVVERGAEAPPEVG